MESLRPEILIAVSYFVGGAAFLALTVLLLTAWRGRLQGALLSVACGSTALWCGVVGTTAMLSRTPFALLQVSELLRDAAWLVFLSALLQPLGRESPRYRRTLHVAQAVLAVLLVSGIGVSLVRHVGVFGLQVTRGDPLPGMMVHLLVAIGGLVLVEQVLRNTRPEHRWAVKYLCFGIGGMFAYDLFLYAHALLFKTMNVETWAARGFAHALVAPLVAVSAARNPSWSVNIFVSRHVVFHSLAILGAGLYLSLMAVAGYYIRFYGGSWGGVAQSVFLFGALVLLAVLVMSGQMRSRIRVFVSKHFYKNRYDYREEWLRFTATLSRPDEEEELPLRVVRAIAAIAESPAGALWTRGADGNFWRYAQFNLREEELRDLDAGEPVVAFMARTGWVVDLDRMREDATEYDGVLLPEWVEDESFYRLLLPLRHDDQVTGLVLLARSDTKRDLNWEDLDLLKTVGQQAAGYIALLQTTEALAEARQFEAFNRLSAYVVHDLKNVVAQLSLITSNAARHRDNPAFVADMIDTVGNASKKMTRMLANLKKGRLEDTSAKLVNVRAIFDKVIRLRAETTPVPEMGEVAAGLVVQSDPERLVTVIEHLVQNAQEATPAGGQVTLGARLDGNWVELEVRDTGCGMAPEFVATRLFRPFDTTKGNAGMGIGVYETREFARANGGDLTVHSAPERGTRFLIRLPCRAHETALEVQAEPAGVRN